MKKILSFLINKTTLVIFGFLLLTFMIWTGGEFLNVDIKYRVFTLLFILIQFLVIFFLKIIFAKKQAGKIESYLTVKAEEDALGMGLDHQEKMESLKTQLGESIEAIKKSKLKKRWWAGRSTALYELPWYIIIGPPSAGKSTLLQSSSLYFPKLSSAGKGIQGVGGTRNCDWWFSNEAIFLDTAGRYSVEEEDQEEWLGFLDLIRKYRKKKPVNGAILGISIADLLEMNEEEIDTTAQKLRTRLDELIQRLKITFPVYIAFTKCDRIHGFIDFFNALTSKEREQVWGYTFSSDELRKNDPLSVFTDKLNELQSTLESLRINILDKVSNQRKRDAAFLFPVQFRALEGKLSRFIKTLIQPNPYQDFPMFRGFYFTCGTQEGSPIDQVINKIGAAMNLAPDIIESFEDFGDKKSYFIKNLFTGIIVPDKELAQIARKTWAFNSLVKVSVIASTIAVSIALIFSFYNSFTNNKTLLNSLRYHLDEVSSIEWQNGSQLVENLESVDLLRKDLKQFDEYEEFGTPLRLGFGLYKGKDVNPHAKIIYFKKLKTFFIDPVQREIERDIEKRALAKPQSGTDEWKVLYDRLKLYLMLAKPDKLENQFVEKELTGIWTVYLKSISVKEKFENKFLKSGLEQLKFYIKQIGKKDTPLVTNNEQIVKLARSALNNIPIKMRLYSNLINDSKSIDTFSLRRSLGGDAAITMKAGHEIPGAFTKSGWDLKIKDSLSNSLTITSKENWILGDINTQLDETERDKVKKELKSIYINDFLKQWKLFLSKIQISPFSDLNDSVKKLEILSDPIRSPYISLISQLRDNMELEPPDLIDQAEETGFIAQAKKKLRLDSIDIKRDEPNPMSAEYKQIIKFIGKKGEKNDKLPVYQYMAALKEVYSLLVEIKNNSESGLQAVSIAKSILSGGTTPVNNGIKITEAIFKDFKSINSGNEINELLLQPFDMAWTTILGLAGGHLNTQWENAVYLSFSQSLEGRYPFAGNASADSSSETAIMDVVNFFKPGEGVVWNFFNKELNSFISFNGETLRSNSWRERGMGFSEPFKDFLIKAKKISDSLFATSRDYPKITFSLHPHTNPSVSEIFLVVEGKSYTFINSPDEWARFTWPVAEDAHGAEIGIKVWKQGWSQEKTLHKSGNGAWGLFRLLGEASIKKEDSTNYKINWLFETGDKNKIPVSFQLKAESYKNPFIEGIFSTIKCPRRIS